MKIWKLSDYEALETITLESCERHYAGTCQQSALCMNQARETDRELLDTQINYVVQFKISQSGKNVPAANFSSLKR